LSARSTLIAALVAVVVVAPAHASQLIDRNATNVTLEVSSSGQALIQYRVAGKQRHVLAWGAVNARIPPATEDPSRPQVKFKVDYSGGWGTYHKLVWKTFRNTCRPYTGPKLPYFLVGCTASDGSLWALQSWQEELPDLGYTPWLPAQRSWRLMLSHWTGPVATIQAYTDWVFNGRWHEVFGRVMYQGRPIHGYRTSRYGAVLDGYGRNIYLDTLGSAYGQGWYRENAFVAHNPNGNFCYSFIPHDPSSGGYTHPPGNTAERPKANGAAYRLTLPGPGVTPDVQWQGKGLSDYNPADPALVDLEKRMNAIHDWLSRDDKLCRTH
jgi:hypothetical protein